MSLESWGALVIVWLAAVMLPGPDVFLLLRLGVRDRKAAVLAACGIMVGNTLWVTATVLGLSTLIRAVPALLPGLQVAGSLILVWLGVQSVRSGVKSLRSPGSVPDASVTNRSFRLGFMTNIANPKALIFFTALLTQFLPAHAGWGLSVAIAVLLIVTGFGWFLTVAWASSSKAFQAWFTRAVPWFDIVAGIVFMLVAVMILFEVWETTSALWSA